MSSWSSSVWASYLFMRFLSTQSCHVFAFFMYLRIAGTFLPYVYSLFSSPCFLYHLLSVVNYLQLSSTRGSHLLYHRLLANHFLLWLYFHSLFSAVRGSPLLILLIHRQIFITQRFWLTHRHSPIPKKFTKFRKWSLFLPHFPHETPSLNMWSQGLWSNTLTQSSPIVDNERSIKGLIPLSQTVALKCPFFL